MPYDRDSRPSRPMNRNKRRKVCQFCADRAEFIDYKDAAKLRRLLSERSKILPRRTTGTCAMGVGADAPFPGGSQRLQLGDQAAVLVEQLPGTVALQPAFQLFQMLRPLHGARCRTKTGRWR